MTDLEQEPRTIDYEFTIRGLAALEQTPEFLKVFASLHEVALQLGDLSLSHTVSSEFGCKIVDQQPPKISELLSGRTVERDTSLSREQLYERLTLFGKNIEAHRSEVRMSARSLATRAGVSPAYIRAIERAQNSKSDSPSQPSATIVFGIAQTLNLDPIEMLEQAGYIVGDWA